LSHGHAVTAAAVPRRIERNEVVMELVERWRWCAGHGTAALMCIIITIIITAAPRSREGEK
jgi:hypothetical protein